MGGYVRWPDVAAAAGGSGVGKLHLHLGRQPIAVLVAAAAVAGCHGAPGTPAAARSPAAARPATPAAPAVSRYLHAGRSSVTYLQWSAAGGAGLTGLLRQAALSGTAPRQALAIRAYPVAGHLRRGRVLVIRIGPGPARGSLSGRDLTLGPLPGSGLTRTFRAATADGFGRAVAALREQVRRSDARTRQLAAGAALRRQQAARAVTRLITAVRAISDARRVVSGQLRGMAEVTSRSAVALEKARGEARTGLARARQGARRVLVCDYAVAVDSERPRGQRVLDRHGRGRRLAEGGYRRAADRHRGRVRAAAGGPEAAARVFGRRPGSQPGPGQEQDQPGQAAYRCRAGRSQRLRGSAQSERSCRLPAKCADRGRRTCRSASPAPAPLATIRQNPVK